MRGEVSFWQVLRAGQLRAEPQYQVPTHKGSREALPWTFATRRRRVPSKNLSAHFRVYLTCRLFLPTRLLEHAAGAYASF